VAESITAGPPLIPVEFDPFAQPAAPDGLPLTEPQREMWLAVQMGDEVSCVFNQCFCLALRGPLSAESMQSALRQVMDRHDALRIAIDADGERQTIATSSQIELPVVDLSRQEQPARAAEIERLLENETRRPFDLAAGPMVRATLIREAPDLHRLVLTVHHIVCDGWSSAIVFGDLARIYAADRHGLPARLPAAVSYRDHVGREAARAQDPQVRADEEYWAQQFADSVPVLELPLERPRPGVKTYRGARQELRLDEPLCRALKAAGAKLGCTPFVTLLAAFEVLLSRLSGQYDLVVGVPMAGQAQLEDGHLVGHCVNVIPLRCRVDPGARFADHLKSARRAFLEAQSHQQLTFGSLLRRLKIAWDPARTPLVAVTFNIDKIGAPFDFGQLALERIESPAKGLVNFELAVNVVDNGRDLLVECEHNSDLFAPATIQRWLGHYQAMLEALASDPGQRIDEVPLLTSADQRRLLVEWNDTKAALPPVALVHTLFEAQEERAPKRTALRAGDTTLSYAALEARANRLAQAMRARGVGRGQRVGLCVERGADMLAAVLGVLKTGAAYVPLDPTFPEERLRFMAQDAELALLVSSSPLAGLFGLPRERQLLLDADAAAIEAHSDLRPSADATRDAGPEDPAYIIYTSGSTGKPKGVVVPHRAVVNFLGSMAHAPGLAADDVLVAVTTLSFDIAVLELQLPLTLGATIVIASRDEAMDGLALKALLEGTRATVMQATPITWRLLLEAGWRGAKNFKALVGGEALPKDLADQLIGRGVELWNLYGPTETTVWSTCARITDTTDGISIGKPIANTTVYVLDGRNNLCPIGVPGELCIGGAGVTLGYWRRPELTAERFIADPFGTVPDGKLYRTGDLARWRDDGTIEHLGRLDFQVKIRGFRIELGEIEAQITSHPAVREAIVVAREDVPGDPRLVAYLVPRAADIDLVELKDRLVQALPAYMVPSAFVVLQAMPQTPNAKVDRKALPAPERTGAETTYIAPRSRTEEAVAASWRKALQVERVGARDNFFELGGRSLMFVRMISEINSTFKMRLGMAELIGNATLEQFAALIDARQARSDRPAVPADRLQSTQSELSTLVQLHEGPAELPMYLIYAGPGELRLAQHMGGTHRVFGIEARWPMAWRDAVMNNRTGEFPSLEQMVAPYVAELSAHVGSTPCVLAGFCYAGRIAFEAAHQLHQLGGKVECVVLIDTDAQPVKRYKLAWQILRQDWKHPVNGSSANGTLRSLGSRMKSTWQTSWWLAGKVKKKLGSYFERPKLDLETLSGVLDERGIPMPWALLERLYGEMEKSYRFRRLDCRGVLFRTGEFEGKQLGYDPDDALGWENLFTRGVEVIPIAGHHFSIWGKQIPTIAREINRVLGSSLKTTPTPKSAGKVTNLSV
jgi:amino acid adenylation domain-containing protein